MLQNLGLGPLLTQDQHYTLLKDTFSLGTLEAAPAASHGGTAGASPFLHGQPSGSCCKDPVGWLVNNAGDMADVAPLLHTTLRCSCLHDAISACHGLFLPLAVSGCRSSSCLRSGGKGQSTQPTALHE